jgi:thioredoxin reductase/bacterioferritin-associated ferredoxin
MNDIVDLVVVGAGPAGMEAALTAAAIGVNVTLIDSFPKPGGQYFKQVPEAFKVDDKSNQHIKVSKYFERIRTSNITVLENTLVWGVFEGSLPGTWCLTLYGPTAPARLNARAIIVASGAFDRSIPFPGWDLPGVITTGAALTLVKHQGILPGKKVILSGTGPLQLAAAAYLVQAGAEVVGVWESATNLFWRGIPHLPALWGQWDRAHEGFGYFKTLLQARVPYHFGSAVIAAHGEDRVNQVVTAKLDGDGKPIPNSETSHLVDTVVVGYNLTPNTEIFRLLNCQMEFSGGSGGFVPTRNSEMETSQSGIFAAGDCAGIGGAAMASIEGRMAGFSAARELGYILNEESLKKATEDKRALKREIRFARLLGDLFTPRSGMYSIAADDTLICRCEEITLGQIRDAISYGAQTVGDVKNIIRTGMGNCQGRTCGSIVANIMAIESGKKLEDVKYFNIRPPLHPLPLKAVEELEPVIH